MNKTDNRRQLLKNALMGQATPEQVREELGKAQPKQLNLDLLTEPERHALQGYLSSYKEAGNSFAGLSEQELGLCIATMQKATPDFPKRHILDRVDLTTLSQEELVQAFVVLNQPWVQVYEKDLPEWLKDARR